VTQPPSASARRYGLLGSWRCRLPKETRSSLDTVTWQTAQALRRRGIEVTVGCWEVQAGDPQGLEMIDIGGRPDWLVRKVVGPLWGGERRLPWSSRVHHPLFLMQGVRALRRHNAQIIQVTHEFANLLPARLIAGRAPLITQLHAVWVDDRPRLTRRLLQADAVATVSDFVRRAVLEAEPRLESRTATVRNGVDLDEFPGRAALVAADSEGVHAWRQKLRTLDRPLVVSVVGQVAPEKGVHVLAEAMRVLAARGHQVAVAVAGPLGSSYQRPSRVPRQPLWREIRRLAVGYPERIKLASDGLPFHLLGRLSSQDVRRLLAAADIFAAPSFSPEPFGLPVLEALAMGLPVVASNDGSYPELVGDAGMLVPPGDAGALADALEELLMWPGNRERLGASARRQAARHTWDATAAQLVSLAERFA
jgi:glycosyltransferase involved in cell wall biosynthesis